MYFPVSFRCRCEVFFVWLVFGLMLVFVLWVFVCFVVGWLVVFSLFEKLKKCFCHLEKWL